jgi:hypothetical protein
MNKDLPELMRPIRAFAAIDISKSRGYEALQRGEVPHVKIAGQIRIPRAWVEEQIRKALTEAGEPIPIHLQRRGDGSQRLTVQESE